MGLNEAGVQLDDLLGRRRVPDGAGVLEADGLAVLLQLAVVLIVCHIVLYCIIV